MRIFRRIRFLPLAAMGVFAVFMEAADSDGSGFDRKQMENFLLNAKVVRSQRIGRGLTNPYRLTLTDGTTTHDAAFQPVNERRNFKQFADGTTEINYVDSYRYNIAAYKLAVLLGIEEMMPVTVERKWKGMIGSLSWWLQVRMDEKERYEKNIRPPDVEAYNRQVHRMRVFAELVYDTDRNIGNMLIGENWQVYMIDFSRAFRLQRDLKDARNLERCSRDLLVALKRLTIDSLTAAVDGFLTRDESEALLFRRDLIVKHYAGMVAEKGEDGVLY